MGNRDYETEEASFKGIKNRDALADGAYDNLVFTYFHRKLSVNLESRQERMQ